MDHALEQEVSNLHHDHGANLLRYAELMADDPDLARDAVQEVFLRYFVERRYGRAIDSPRAWLYQVLRNYVLDRLKSFPLNRQVPPEILETLPAGQATPEEAVCDSEMARQLAAALTRRELDCLRLRAQGLSYLEIAQAMEIRPGTVGALLARIQRKIGQTAYLTPRTGFIETATALRYLVRETWAYSSN